MVEEEKEKGDEECKLITKDNFTFYYFFERCHKMFAIWGVFGVLTLYLLNIYSSSEIEKNNLNDHINSLLLNCTNNCSTLFNSYLGIIFKSILFSIATFSTFCLFTLASIMILLCFYSEFKNVEDPIIAAKKGSFNLEFLLFLIFFIFFISLNVVLILFFVFTFFSIAWGFFLIPVYFVFIIVGIAVAIEKFGVTKENLKVTLSILTLVVIFLILLYICVQTYIQNLS